MAYYVPYASQGFCDPASLVQMPQVHDPVSAWFDFDTYNAEQAYPHVHTNPYGLQGARGVDQAIAGVYASPPSFQVEEFSAPAPPPARAQSAYASRPSFLKPHEEFYASRVDNGPSQTAYATCSRGSVSSISSAELSAEDAIIPACRRDHAHERRARISWSDLPMPPCACKHGPADMDSEYIPSSRKRSHLPASTSHTSKTKRSTPNPLPASLQPIKVKSGSGALPRCPMPKCGVEIEDCDAAWRGHFKKVHHDDLCLKPGCRRLSSGCKARCPVPMDGCKACGDDRAVRPSTMTIESVGRHLLNVHIKVVYRCPVCGVEQQWRESACARHIRRCLEKQEAERRGGC